MIITVDQVRAMIADSYNISVHNVQFNGITSKFELTGLLDDGNNLKPIREPITRTGLNIYSEIKRADEEVRELSKALEILEDELTKASPAFRVVNKQRDEAEKAYKELINREYTY